jgi:hypothetical protein
MAMSTVMDELYVQLLARERELDNWEVTPPLHSPLGETLPLLSDIFHRKAGIIVGAHRLK